MSKPVVLITLLLAPLMIMRTNAQKDISKDLIGTWIGISHQSVIVVTYRNDGTFAGSLQTPSVGVSVLYEGNWKVSGKTFHASYRKSSGPVMRVPFEDKDEIVEITRHHLIAKAQDGREVIFTRVQFHRPARPRPTWSPIPPPRLTTEFYREAKSFEEIDSTLWTYLCDLSSSFNGTHREQVRAMFNDITPELRRYYHTRLFDWERGSEGLEGCMMRDEDDLFIEQPIQAYEELGAKKHAEIIRRLIPIAQRRMKEIEKAEADGKEFDFDKNNPFKPFEPQWDRASRDFDFYDIIWRDMKKRPDKYSHPLSRRKD